MADIKIDKIKVKRGLKANLPTLDIGEPAYCTDTKEFFVGTAEGNVLVNDLSELASKVDKVTGKGLSTNDYDNVEKGEVAKVKDKADKTYVDTELGKKASQSALDATNANVAANTSALAEMTTIKGTTQNVIFNPDGTVQKVQHKDSNNAVLREDVFTYATNLITEVRTLSSGGSVTFKYHLDTLQTEVI